MLSYATRHRSVATLFWLATVMQAGARRARVAANRLDAWFEKRHPSTTPRVSRTLDEHELFDVGLTYIGVQRAAWGGFDRNLRPAPRLHVKTELRRNAARALVRCSLFLHIGLIGVAALSAGLLQLFDGEANRQSAPLLALCGAVLAATSWHRARSVLEPTDQPSAAEG